VSDKFIGVSKGIWPRKKFAPVLHEYQCCEGDGRRTVKTRFSCKL